MPDLSTNRMPVSAARSGTGGRPPFGRGRGGGKRGASSAHARREQAVWPYPTNGG
jgi:hypothetical protein